MGHPDSKDPSSLHAQGSTVQYEYTHSTRSFLLSHTRRDPSTKDGSSCREADRRMGHPDSKDPSNLYAQGLTVQYEYTHIRQGHFFSGRDPSTKDGSSCREADKRMGHPDSKDPSSLYAQGSTVQYEYTHTRQGHFFSLTHVGTPRLKMGHLVKKLTKGWGILTTKIPLGYMLKLNGSVRVHTH